MVHVKDVLVRNTLLVVKKTFLAIDYVHVVTDLLFMIVPIIEKKSLTPVRCMSCGS